MSKPVPTTDVEDVLSSIRRLVGEGARPVVRSGHADASDRLVLTPAFRVAQTTSTAHVSSLADTFVLNDPLTPTPTPEPEEKEEPVTTKTPLRSSEPLVLTPENAAAAAPKQVETASTLSAKIAALETAIGGISTQWEPDTPGSDDYSGTRAPAMSWAEDVELDANGNPLDLPHEELERPHQKAAKEAVKRPVEDAVDDDDDTTILDEDSLRELVADIVRSELQGELGERITRNVRKLVRREIQRALTARDLQ